MAERDRVLRLVRRARRRLEAARLLKAAARGALAGTAAGLLVTPFRLSPWAFPAAGAAAGLLLALFRRPIGLGSAALFLDHRLGTAERFATVATRPPDPLTDRVAGELAAVRRLPRSPLPRETALVPLALFLLFAAGLLPAAPAPEPAPGFAVAAAGAGDGEEAAPVDAEAVERLARGVPPAPAEIEAMREALERQLRRPEERRAALAALERARRGEEGAGAAVAEALRPRPADPKKGAALLPSAYPEAEEFVHAYRRALQEGRE
jgi:hypothetical protein